MTLYIPQPLLTLVVISILASVLTTIANTAITIYFHITNYKRQEEHLKRTPLQGKKALQQTLQEYAVNLQEITEK